jgi:hypothetical protein
MSLLKVPVRVSEEHVDAESLLAVLSTAVIQYMGQDGKAESFLLARQAGKLTGIWPPSCLGEHDAEEDKQEA